MLSGTTGLVDPSYMDLEASPSKEIQLRDRYAVENELQHKVQECLQQD